jgi:hypothetical protein
MVPPARGTALLAKFHAPFTADDEAAMLELGAVTESLSLTTPATVDDAVGSTDDGNVPVVMRDASMLTVVAAEDTFTFARLPDASMRVTPAVCNAVEALNVGPVSAPVMVPPARWMAVDKFDDILQMLCPFTVQ